MSFTREEIVKAANVDPWDVAQGFDQEVSEPEMAAASRAFAEAASSAGDAGKTARLASAIQGESAQTDWIPHHDPEENIRITDQSLQGGGTDIEVTAHRLNQAMGLAIETQDEVTRQEEKLTRLFAERVEAAHRALSEHSAAQGGPLARSAEQDGMAAAATAAAAEAIRKQYLDLAVQDAHNAHTAMRDAIGHYRSQLMKIGADLKDHGYDVAYGPHRDMWYGEGAAEYQAELTRVEANRDIADPAGVQEAVGPLKQMMEQVRNGEPLSPAERAYLMRYFNTLRPEDLRNLGNLDAQVSSTEDFFNALVQIGDAQSTIANGINALTNQAMNVEQGVETADIPQSVAHFVHAYDANMFLGISQQGDEEARRRVDEFNAFGSLMGQSDLAGGKRFSADLIGAAVSFQEAVEAGNAELATDSQSGTTVQVDNPLRNHGSSGMLHAAALNQPAAIGAFADTEMTSRLLGKQWADSAGVAELVRSAAIQAPGDEGLAHQQRDATRNILSQTARHPDLVLGDGMVQGNAVHPVNHDALQTAVVDTAIAHIGDLNTPGGGRMGLPTAEQEQLFEFFAKTEPGTHERFKTQVAEWERRQIEQLLESIPHKANPAHGMEVQRIVDEVGFVDGMVAHGERKAYEDVMLDEDDSREFKQKLATGGAKALVGAVPIVGGALSEGVDLLVPEYEQRVKDQMEARNREGVHTGDLAIRQLAASVAEQNRLDAHAPAERRLNGSEVLLPNFRMNPGRLAPELRDMEVVHKYSDEMEDIVIRRAQFAGG
ncbi:hypothetical protein [Streptomyces sp. CB03238]|uniref:hypothetical protein n=1 Tax=Streptomyces sp. CB03238 TaxID=1907777 RepID=UPI00117E5417|nr:hypothetical protein [Streptomyces sp. CB03238]